MATTRLDLRRTRAELERGLDLGWHTGAQLFVSVGDATIELALGEARPGVAMSPASIVEWASATKAVTSCSVALLWERSAFELDDPVCQYVSEFSGGDKRGITVRHLLTHTAGLTDPVDRVMPFGDAVAAVCAAPLVDGWTPGARRAYCSAGMWMLSALVARRVGRPFGAFVREEIFEPLGMVDCWIGMPAEVFRACRDRIAVMPGFAASGTEEWVTWGRPTGGGHGPIGQLGRFYRALLERRLLSSPVIEAMTTRHLAQVYDERLDATVDWGLGFCLASSYREHGYGPHASRRAFGHGGATGASRSLTRPSTSRPPSTGTARLMRQRTQSASTGCWASSTRNWGWHPRGNWSLNGRLGTPRRTRERSVGSAQLRARAYPRLRSRL